MFGRLPSYGLYCRHVKGLRLRHLELRSASGDARPAIVCDDVKDLDIDGFRSTPVTGAPPVIRLLQSKRACLRGCSAPEGTRTFLDVQGDRSDQVVLMNNDLHSAVNAVLLGPGLPTGVVTQSGNIVGGSNPASGI